MNSSDALRAFLEGFLPTLALLVLMILLPIVLRALAIRSGLISWSAVDGQVLSQYFAFQVQPAPPAGVPLGWTDRRLQVVHTFLVTTLASSVFGSLKQIADDPKSIASLLGTSLPAVRCARCACVRVLAGPAPTRSRPRSGFELLHQLRGAERARRVPI